MFKRAEEEAPSARRDASDALQSARGIRWLQSSEIAKSEDHQQEEQQKHCVESRERNGLLAITFISIRDGASSSPIVFSATASQIFPPINSSSRDFPRFCGGDLPRGPSPPQAAVQFTNRKNFCFRVCSPFAMAKTCEKSKISLSRSSPVV